MNDEVKPSVLFIDDSKRAKGSIALASILGMAAGMGITLPEITPPYEPKQPSPERLSKAEAKRARKAAKRLKDCKA